MRALRTLVLAAAVGLTGLALAPGAAEAHGGWYGYGYGGYYRPPPPPPFYYRPPPPPPVYYAPPPPRYYGPRYYPPPPPPAYYAPPPPRYYGPPGVGFGVFVR